MQEEQSDPISFHAIDEQTQESLTTKCKAKACYIIVLISRKEKTIEETRKKILSPTVMEKERSDNIAMGDWEWRSKALALLPKEIGTFFQMGPDNPKCSYCFEIY